MSIFAHTSKELQLDLFSKIKKSISLGGFFLLEGYNSNQLKNCTGGPKSIDMMFDLEELKDAFKEFEIVFAKNVSREINEGTYHNGTSDVVQFLCRKV